MLTGPLSFLDDGRGLARSRVPRHKHEAETGRTSSIAEDQHMRLTAKGQCLALERHHAQPVARDLQLVQPHQQAVLLGGQPRRHAHGLCASHPPLGAPDLRRRRALPGRTAALVLVPGLPRGNLVAG